MTPMEQTWLPHLRELCDSIRSSVSAAMARQNPAELSRILGQGAGDISFGIDAPAERAADAWLERHARRGPVSLLTEESGWRHRGPGADGRPVDLAGFDHGGPRICLDPVDGTRNLMVGLRSAFTVVALAPPGAGQPHLDDAGLGLVSELPTGSDRNCARLVGLRGRGCSLERLDFSGKPHSPATTLRVDERDDTDNGYFCFFRFSPSQRPAIAALEAAFFARLAKYEGARRDSWYDDQYCSNGAQLFLTAMGTYRMVADLRACLAQRCGDQVVTAKPYDLAGAVICAQAAGCVVTAPDNTPLAFPLDATTPVSFVAWANPASAARLAPHLLACLDSAD
ncbi:MAG TPA: inositol monophosphatase family protein [Planctomycetota bacterium]|nr:inositol monophosphatase family protein [Planctomycetota bacterium]